MKYVGITRLAGGVDNVKASFEAFGRIGLPENTQTFAGVDGKTFISIIDGDPDLVNSMTFGPFCDDVTIIPVVDIDDAWIAAATAAFGNLPD